MQVDDAVNDLSVTDGEECRESRMWLSFVPFDVSSFLFFTVVILHANGRQTTALREVPSEWNKDLKFPTAKHKASAFPSFFATLPSSRWAKRQFLVATPASVQAFVKQLQPSNVQRRIWEKEIKNKKEIRALFLP